MTCVGCSLRGPSWVDVAGASQSVAPTVWPGLRFRPWVPLWPQTLVPAWGGAAQGAESPKAPHWPASGRDLPSVPLPCRCWRQGRSEQRVEASPQPPPSSAILVSPPRPRGFPGAWPPSSSARGPGGTRRGSRPPPEACHPCPSRGTAGTRSTGLSSHRPQAFGHLENRGLLLGPSSKILFRLDSHGTVYGSLAVWAGATPRLSLGDTGSYLDRNEALEKALGGGHPPPPRRKVPGPAARCPAGAAAPSAHPARGTGAWTPHVKSQHPWA